MKKTNPIALKIILGILLLPVLLLILLQTPPGKALLASTLSRMMSGSDNLDVKIGKISGWIPAAVQIDRLEIGDAEGVWLTADGMHCRWMIRDLVDRRIRVERLGARTIELHRFPKAGKSDSSSRERREFQPLEVVLDRVAIEHLKLGEAVAGMPLEYSVHSGGLRLLPSGRLTGELNVGGDAEGRVELDALLGVRHDNRLTILAELERVTNPSFGLDLLSGHAEATLTPAGLRGSVSASVRKDEFEGQLSTQLEFSQQQLRFPYFGITAAGYSAEGNLSLDFSKEAIGILFDADLADAATNTYSIHAAATVSTSNESWTVDFNPLEIHCFDVVGFSLVGAVAPNRLALNGSLTEFDLKGLPISGISNFTGRVDGVLSVLGSLAKPEIRAELDVARFTSSQEALDELPELNFHISGELADGRIQGASILTNAATGHLEASFRMPCAFSLEPAIFRPDLSGFHADFKADMDFGILNQLAIFNDQRIAGKLKAELVYNRSLSGFVRVEQGAYEHFDWGIVVRDMALDLVATEEGLWVNTATATDGGDGRIAVTGGVVSNRLALALDLAKAAIIKRDDVAGTLSGQLEIGGPLAHPEVAGLLVVDRADILIDNIAPALPPLLTNYDAHATTNAIAVTVQRQPLPFGLDVQVDLADQVFVNASMIDSVWGGTLQVKDVPQGISVRGVVEPRRGYVSFIGKKFRFTDGQIDLDGSVPPAPSMAQVTAEYNRSDFTARLILNGRIDNPDFRLESSPAMPEDEILSHVLFGRDTSSISPYQAYQIAAAARQLSGGMNGPGFMYQMRRAVGVDTLEWREGGGEDEASSLAAGKYLTSALYVEVNRSLDEKGGMGMMAEYEVTKHFSVETSTGPKMRPGIGVNWKNDY